MEITRLKLSELEPNAGQIPGLPTNPRQWTKTDVDKLARSLKETPELFEARPIIAVQHGGRYVILGGNMRYEASKVNKAEAVPVVIMPEDTSTDKLKEIVLKDNGTFGAWDWDMLANEWDDQPLSDWGVPVWDNCAREDEQIEANEDNFDEETDEIGTKCNPDDIWVLGEHRLICGDSSDPETLRKLMEGEVAEMVFTDPPYGVAIGDKNKELNTVQKAGRCTKNIENDTISGDDLYAILRKAMENVRENCADDACYFVCSPPGGDFALMLMMMQDAGLKVRHIIVWNKSSATFSLGRLDYDYKHEPIMYTWTKSHHNYRGGAFRTSVWDIDKPRKCDLHPTMKPVELVANCILDGTKKGDIVLDAFGGSGTTLVASEQLGRKCRIIEMDPHYCDVIIARWEKMTGKTAIKQDA